MKKRDKLVFFAFLLFIASFFFPLIVVLNVFAMGLLVLVALVDDPLAKKIKIFKERRHTWFMLAFAGFLLISFFLSGNHHSGLRALQLRIPLFLFPVSIGLMRIRKEMRDRVLLGMAVIVTISCIASLCFAIYQYSRLNDEAWFYNDSLSFLIGQQSIYTSVFVNISIYVFAYFLLTKDLSRLRKILLGLAVLVLFVISYLLASRNMMTILYASTLIFAFYSILRKRKFLLGGLLLIGFFLVGLLVFQLFPKTINRFRELGFTHFNYQSQAKESHYGGVLTPDQWNGANFRLAAWRCGWQLFKEHPVAGVGLGDKKDDLFSVYRQRDFQFALTTRKNVHNNYLDILFSTGLIGLLLFLLGWIVLPFVQLVRARDGLAVLILLTFTLAMVTENYFDRGIGAMLFGFFVPFLLASAGKRE